LNRMSAPAGAGAPMPVAAWPTSTFSGKHKEFYYNGEGIQIVHVAAAHTDGDSIVFFRRSDVIATGDIYSTVSYPIIDAQRGGSITGVLDGLNQLLDLVIAGEKTEGGTMIVPGHGRISDEADLVEYRDMVTIIRDRTQDMVNRGMTIAQVQAARPTMEYDGLYGSAPGWSSTQFVEAVFRGLRPERSSQLGKGRRFVGLLRFAICINVRSVNGHCRETEGRARGRRRHVVGDLLSRWRARRARVLRVRHPRSREVRHVRRGLLPPVASTPAFAR